MLLVRMRCPCAGRHLLFFAAAKKSRQKKAAHTANPCSCLRAPNRSYASHGSQSVRVSCQRPLCTPHPLHMPASQHIVSHSPPPPRWQTVCRLSRHTRITPHWVARMVFLVRALPCTQARPTHSLPPMGPKSFDTIDSCYGCSKRVMRSFKALATQANSTLPCEARDRLGALRQIQERAV
jgi:hypothetical protein